MPDIASLIAQGSSNLWIFIPTAILLGALHGMEPGHSKTMMAAFIIAVRGTVGQAALLGLAATVSHTVVVWVVALGGVYLLGDQFSAEGVEPYFKVASGILMMLIAAWMLRRIWVQQHDRHHDHEHDDHHHDHDHGHEENHHHHHDDRYVGHAHVHGCACHIGDDEDDEEFLARLEAERLEAHDAHALAHAKEIERRFAGAQNVTTGQIVLFGLTGGLIPCPASITLLLLCLQLNKITLGATLVLGFSVGLAITMVFTGVVAALSLRHAQKRWSGFSTIAHKAPYFSGGIIVAIGLYVAISGAEALI